MKLPNRLTSLKQWVVWKAIPDGDKVKKKPYNAETGVEASTTDSSTWTTYEKALTAEGYDGLGFVFTASDNICGVDLDDCFDETGEPKGWTQKILDEIVSYTELSPSGKGLHIILEGHVPPGGNRKGPVEIYDHARFFTMTGEVYNNRDKVLPGQKGLERVHSAIFKPIHGVATTAPVGTELSEDEIRNLLRLAIGADNGMKFGRLWNGEWKGSYNSQSEADVALCSLLAFWTSGNLVAVDQLFRRSALYRPKWDRDDYRLATLEKALQQQNGYHKEPGDLLSEGADDEGNAQCVFYHNKDQILYCEAFGWLTYNETHWKSETAEAEIDRIIINTLKERRAAAAAAEADFEAVVRAARPSATHMRNCKTLLQSLVTIPISDFDCSRDHLNCKNGILDLKTGELTPHSREQYFTYCVPVEYDPEADQSEWKDWLRSAVGGGSAVLSFLQKAVGYSLTGHTREEIMFYIWGPPRAGKGTFAETIIALLGGNPLALEVDIGMFTESRRADSQNFDLAGLKSTRFVVASESKETHWLDGAKLKRWTGGNWVRCAHKYKGFFTYRPQFKIWLTSNFPLQIDPDDEAAWTRPQVIEFPHSWIGREDKTLKDRMRSPDVLPGVFAWAVEGAMQWYELSKGGLRAPAEVRDNTSRARQDLDWVARWVEEDIEITGNEDDFIPNSDLYPQYQAWCQERGAPVKKLPALNRTLSAKGYGVGIPKWYDGKTQRGWVGVRRIRGHNEQVLARLGEQIEDE